VISLRKKILKRLHLGMEKILKMTYQKIRKNLDVDSSSGEES
jgi:hypothetical protein